MWKQCDYIQVIVCFIAIHQYGMVHQYDMAGARFQPNEEDFGEEKLDTMQ